MSGDHAKAAAGQRGEGLGMVGRSWHGSRLQDSSCIPAGTPCRRENRAGCPPTPDACLVVEAVRQFGARARSGGARTVASGTQTTVSFPHQGPRAAATPPSGQGALVVPDGRQVEVEEHEQIVERVAAIDVAKASGMVCTRMPPPTIPGKRVTRVW